METQNSNQSPAAATEEAAATKNGGNATQEVSSTTQAVEPNKRSLRVQTWKKLRENKFGVRFLAIFNRIPGFVDSDKAGELLAETEEFKKANNIKVLIDRPLYAAKLQTLLAGKNLYLPGTRESKALYLKVDVPADATEEEKTAILNVQNVEKHRTEISLQNKIELDMVIIGSVVVSRDGYRIGRGNGFNDLDIGLLCEIGSITDKTVIATMVHDAQVVDSLPSNLFQKYDTPVDLIITPTQVIRVDKRLPRPAGIFWELLSERRLKIIPVLQELKEAQEKDGKVIVLKEEDTDIEQNSRNNRRHFMQRRRFGFRRYQRRTTSQNNAEQQQDGENNVQQERRNPPQRRRFINRRRRPTKSEGDQSGVESKSQDRKSVGEGRNRRPKPRRNRMTRDFSVKLTNITRDVRIRDLKSELRNRQCNPMAITWKGQPVEPNKRSLRVQTWKKLRENKFGVRFLAIFNRIPGFVDSDKAGELLAETEEFKKANNIKVLIDRPLYAAKLQTLLAGKNLYLPGTRESKALYLKVDVPADATEEEKTAVLNVQNIEKHRTEISLENKIELDMVIIGSVVVSRDGYRIGRGNGFNDLDIGLLCEIGSITDKTVIATMVHDAQVVDSLPSNLFQKYDTPVDLIITPTQVIRVAKRLPRPAGIFWELLSERRLKIIPVLQELKEAQEKDGKVIVLKEEVTDIEQNSHTSSDNNAEQQQDGENHIRQQRRNPPQRKRFINRRRRPTKSEGDQSGVESKSQDRKSVGEGRNKRPKSRRNRMTRDFSVKLTNITRDVRIRDLKSELRNRQCNPMAITWKGQYGRCYLHFGHRNGQPSNEDEMNKVLEALNDLSLTITPNSYKNKNDAATTNGEGDGASGDNSEQQEQKTEAEAATTKPTKVINLKVELIKRNDKTNTNASETAGAGGTVNGGGDPTTGGDASSARIESVDTTTV